MPIPYQQLPENILMNMDGEKRVLFGASLANPERQCLAERLAALFEKEEYQLAVAIFHGPETWLSHQGHPLPLERQLHVQSLYAPITNTAHLPAKGEVRQFVKSKKGSSEGYTFTGKLQI